MKTEKVYREEFFVSFEDAGSQFLQTASSFTEDEINAVAYKDCWTAAQVAEHVTRSNEFIAQALAADGSVTDRNADMRAGELKKMFLDFTVKMVSPDMILPTRFFYEKEEVVDNLKRSIMKLRQLAKTVNLSEAIDDPIFGNITKLELLYFVMYHTQRHTHQLENIFKIIGNRLFQYGKN